MRRPRDRHELGVAWIGYTDFMATIAVVFMTLWLIPRHDVLHVNVRGRLAPSLLDQKPFVEVGGKRVRMESDGSFALPCDVPKGLSVLVVARDASNNIVGRGEVTPGHDGDWGCVVTSAPVVIESLDEGASFERSRADLLPQALPELNDMVVLHNLRNLPPDQLLVICGHTDDTVPRGMTESYNQDLSAKRALATAKYLITQCGIRKEHVAVVGFGSSQPKVDFHGLRDNALENARAANRRVEIVLSSGGAFGLRVAKP